MHLLWFNIDLGNQFSVRGIQETWLGNEGGVGLDTDDGTVGHVERQRHTNDGWELLVHLGEGNYI